MAEPAAKRAKTEPDAAEAVEFEEDAPADKAPRIQSDVGFATADTTMNVMQSTRGSMLMALSDGGLQYFLAGARANCGMKSGRYAFEARIIEALSLAEEPGSKGKTPQPRCHVRIGLATSSSSLFLGETEESICFDTSGCLVHKGQRTKLGKGFGLHAVVAVVLNLDIASPHANTLSLFVDGVRICKPQKLPEALIGKALYPAISFRSVTVQYNFGATPLGTLPFKCRFLQDASAKDVEQRPAPGKGAKHEVLFPVCLPDEGTFDWLDAFLREHSQYTEISDRAILRWAELSGISTQKSQERKASNDKPEVSFGVASLDDGSVQKALLKIAPLQRRSYVVMEVRGNLMQEERQAQLQRWPGHAFKRIAAVMMNDPPPEFRRAVHLLLLREKQAAADKEFRARMAEERRKRDVELRMKKVERDRKRMLKKQRKAAEEAKRKIAIEKKKREAAQRGEEYDPDADEDMKPKAEEKSDVEPLELEDQEPPEQEPPAVQLTDEEKAVVFRKQSVPDLTPYALNTSFAKFSLPGAEEGFDSVRFDWANADKCRETLSAWISEKRNTTRVEDIQPGEWFASRWKEWQETLSAWHLAQKQYKNLVFKYTAEKKKQVSAARVKAARAKEAADNRAKLEAEKAQAEGEDAMETEEAAIEAPAEVAPEEEGPKEPGNPDFDKLDVYASSDVLDIGGGEPLFSRFSFEDWAMLSLRAELTLLTHAFKRDVQDSDRLGMHIAHLGFYYTKYFKKPWNLKFFGVETVVELLRLIRDTIVVSKRGKVVCAEVPADLESFGIFAMLTEAARRDRVRRVDTGDESARLHIKVHGHGTAAAAGQPGLSPMQPKGAPPKAHGTAAQAQAHAQAQYALVPTQVRPMQPKMVPAKPSGAGAWMRPAANAFGNPATTIQPKQWW